MTATHLAACTGPTARPTTRPDRRNTVVLVGFTAATNLADGVLKMALPLLAAQLTHSAPWAWLPK
jgi:hypothetical protein